MVVGVLVGVIAELASGAADLCAGARSATSTGGAQLDVVVGVRRADKARTGAIEVAEVPVHAVGEGILELQDAVVEVASPLDILTLIPSWFLIQPRVIISPALTRAGLGKRCWVLSCTID